MGLPPSEVRNMSLWQFSAVIEGWNRAQDPESAKRLTDEEADELFAMIDETPSA